MFGVEPEECPFCDHALVWRGSDRRWIHPNNGCVLVGIGLHNVELVRKWNREAEIKTAEDSPIDEPCPPPPPSSVASVPSAARLKKWVNLQFTVNGGDTKFRLSGMVDLSETERNYRGQTA